MKRIIAHKLPIDSDGPILVRSIARYEGEFADKFKDPALTYIDVEDDVEVDLHYEVIENEDSSYTFKKYTS